MEFGNYIVIAKRQDGTLFSDTVTTDTPHRDFREIYRHSTCEIVEVVPSPANALERIAKDKLEIETLEARNSDSLDFHEVSVWHLRMALEAAYAQGRKDALAKEV